MSTSTKATGLALALAAASLMGTAAVQAAPSESANVHCYGVTACKGHNDCKTAENACKGQAACKGHGFVSIPAATCDHMGGTVGD
jgi:uncharacterized membrane protein